MKKKLAMTLLSSLPILTSSSFAIHAVNYRQQSKQALSLSDIHKLSISGYVNASLHLSNKNQLQFYSKGLQVKQHLHTLYLHSKKISAVDIWIPKPKIITLADSAQLSFKAHSHLPIQITLKNNSYAKLKGQVNLTQITSSGQSNLYINQLRGKILDIQAKNQAVIYLRGRVEHLSARLRNKTRLDSRQLQLKSTWVQAAGKSIAKVSPRQDLRAFATESAQILYYQAPLHHTFFTNKNANILLIR
jgi:hypothetical protein